MDYRGPFRRVDGGRIDCEILIGEAWHPFTADVADEEGYGRLIHAHIEDNWAGLIDEPGGGDAPKAGGA